VDSNLEEKAFRVGDYTAGGISVVTEPGYAEYGRGSLDMAAGNWGLFFGKIKLRAGFKFVGLGTCATAGGGCSF
jgi:hypothetical protein